MRLGDASSVGDGVGVRTLFVAAMFVERVLGPRDDVALIVHVLVPEGNSYDVVAVSNVTDESCDEDSVLEKDCDVDADGDAVTSRLFEYDNDTDEVRDDVGVWVREPVTSCVPVARVPVWLAVRDMLGSVLLDGDKERRERTRVAEPMESVADFVDDGNSKESVELADVVRDAPSAVAVLVNDVSRVRDMDAELERVKRFTVCVSMDTDGDIESLSVGDADTSSDSLNDGERVSDIGADMLRDTLVL